MVNQPELWRSDTDDSDEDNNNHNNNNNIDSNNNNNRIITATSPILPKYSNVATGSVSDYVDNDNSYNNSNNNNINNNNNRDIIDLEFPGQRTNRYNVGSAVVVDSVRNPENTSRKKSSFQW